MQYKIRLCVLLLMIFFKSFIVSQPPALPNLGNTCYQNALIQALNSLDILVQRVLKNYKLYQNNDFLKSYSDVVYAMQKNGDVVQAVKDFNNTSCLVLPGFKKGAHKDASELFSGLRFQFEKEEYSREGVSDLFKFYTALQQECNNVILDTNISINYQINIPVNKSIVKGIEDVAKKEKSAMYEGCFQFTRIKNFPDILLLVINRFVPEPKRDPVAIPSVLTKKDFMTLLADKNMLVIDYDLKAIVMHHGSLKSGHFTAYVKDIADGLWYLCDDGLPNVILVGKTLSVYVDSEETAKKEKRVKRSSKYYDYTKNSYMLFYESSELKTLEMPQVETQSVDFFAQALSSIVKG